MGHSIHPVLIVFPLGLLSIAVIFDIIYLINGNPDYNIASGYAIGAVAIALLALNGEPAQTATRGHDSWSER
jgi:uncharacterized membrane protein